MRSIRFEPLTLQCGTEPPCLLGAEQRVQQAVAALADLAGNSFGRNGQAYGAQYTAPYGDMDGIRIDERPVDIEDQRLDIRSHATRPRHAGIPRTAPNLRCDA